MSLPALPSIFEFPTPPSVTDALRAFADWPQPVLFDSASRRPGLGRYSFLSADPVETIRVASAAGKRDLLAALNRWQSMTAGPDLAGFPPFQGGVAGLLTYEAGQAWERYPTAKTNEFDIPALTAGVYDWVIAWDHDAARAWILAQGLPASEPVERRSAARQRIARVQARLGGDRVPPLFSTPSQTESKPLPRESLSPQFDVPNAPGVTSNFSQAEYLAAVNRGIDYIRAGDIFQVNLSQRLLFPATGTPVELYARLRACNPAPFAGYFSADDWAVASASPERFLQVENRLVETRPIKGTRRRAPTPEADLFIGDDLLASTKDHAENVMIVDLLRNDLSRVCQPGTVRVPQLCGLETYETVQHLVSVVQGRLKPECSTWDLLAAAFPGGSITGAPKVRAMEIIAELEPTARGPYCGTLFYRGFNGRMDSSILIRTFTQRRGWVQCPVGGGVTAASRPEDEYQETLDKARGMLRVLSP
jgi:para-aminobenzoate synthetase component 1